MYYHKLVNTITGEETVTELSAAEIKVVEDNIAKAKAEEKVSADKAIAKAALLQRLGITADEAALLF